MTSLQTWLYALSIALAGSVMAGLVGVGRLMQKVNGHEERLDKVEDSVLEALKRFENKIDRLDERWATKWDDHLGFHMEKR